MSLSDPTLQKTGKDIHSPYRTYLLALLVLGCHTIALAQKKTFRRHFIIAYDVSTPFIRAEKANPSYRQGLVDLFSNSPVKNYTEGNEKNLAIEKNNGLPFFNPSEDEISFFHFNVASSEFPGLRNYTSATPAEIIDSFNNCFLRDKKFNWSGFTRQSGATIDKYINSLFNIDITPPVFGDGVSMSNFVYPMVLSKTEQQGYAGEYVIILLSDFLTGSMLGNKEDFSRIKDIYYVPENADPPRGSAPAILKDFMDNLSSAFNKIDYFEYAYPGLKNSIGIIGYKIKPKAGVLNPEDVALFFDNDLKIRQRGFEDPIFSTNEARIKFTHNAALSPVELELVITRKKGSYETKIFTGIIAAKDSAGKWVSNYTGDETLMEFDSSLLTYKIPSLEIPLQAIVHDKIFDNLQFRFAFKMKYEVIDANPLNFIYTTEKIIPDNDVHYSTKALIITMYYILPPVLIMILVICLVFYGKPRRLALTLNGYLDSFEKTDYTTVGKLTTPYKFWNTQLDYLLVNGEMIFQKANYIFNWNSPVSLRLSEINIPEGFEVFLKRTTEDLKEFGMGNSMLIQKKKANGLQFIVGIRQNDITKKLTQPNFAKIKIEASVHDSKFFLMADIREVIDYKFTLGPDLGDVWVGFDPGTTGSCVAVGNAADNILLIQENTKDKERIIPSILVFDTSENFVQNGSAIPPNVYKYGSAGNFFITASSQRYRVFQSIKKLLGFNLEKDHQKIIFTNGNSLNLKGKELAGLLVKGLNNELSKRISNLDTNPTDYLNSEKKFDPKRAVVAIPNNFTLIKIQDMIDCIASLNQFAEIRYIYEAEAVLFYYLSNFKKFNGDVDSFKQETVLIFDMGGSTINATVVNTEKRSEGNRTRYFVDYRGKIGYGIGGDTIDYCIIKFLLSFEDEYPVFKKINLEAKKIEFAKLALEIKKQIVENYYARNAYLITAFNLESFINKALNVSIIVDDETSEMYKYFKKDANNNYKLFQHPLFFKTIFSNVADAIKEVIELSGNTAIEKIVFSGRSTAFPMIRETVERQFKSGTSKPKSISLGLEESKTAVAKGACWYGINNGFIHLNNLKTNASFGFKKTMSADQTNVKYYELIEMGRPFDTYSDGIDSYTGIEHLNDDFTSDVENPRKLTPLPQTNQVPIGHFKLTPGYRLKLTPCKAR